MPTLKSSETFDGTGTMDMRNMTVYRANDSVARAELKEQELVEFPIPLTGLRIHDDIDTVLPETAATDDLAMIEGTFGTDAPTVQSSDAKATTVTQRARAPEVIVPECYNAGATLKIRIRGGMITTISDTTATVDVECYKHDEDGSVGSDLCTTAAQSINDLSKAELDFTITPTGVTAGDVLDVRVTIAITDGATGTAVIGEVSRLVLACDIKG